MTLCVINAVFQEADWLNCEDYVEASLKSAEGKYVEFGPGFWVFRFPEAAGAILALESLFAARRVAFVSLQLEAPLRCGITAEQAAALEAAGIPFYNVARQ